MSPFDNAPRISELLMGTPSLSSSCATLRANPFSLPQRGKELRRALSIVSHGEIGAHYEAAHAEMLLKQFDKVGGSYPRSLHGEPYGDHQFHA